MSALDPPAPRRRWGPLLVAGIFLPSLTLLTALGALAFFATPRELEGVRVFGGPTDTPAPYSISLECSRFELGTDHPEPIDALELDIDGEKVHTRCDPAGQGFATFHTLSTAHPGAHEVTIRTGERLLAHGSAHLSQHDWAMQTQHRDTHVRFFSAGDSVLHGQVDGGIFRLNRWSLLRVAPPGDGKQEDLRFSGEGVDLGPVTSQGGLGWTFQVRPRFLTFTLVATRGETQWQMRGVAQAATFDRVALGVTESDLRATVFSGVGLTAAYARIEDERGPHERAAFSLQLDKTLGTSRGELQLPRPSTPSWLVISEAPGEVSDTALILALNQPAFAPMRETPDQLWVDPFPAWVSAEQDRVHRARRVVFSYVLASGALAVLLLGMELLSQRRALRRVAEAVGETRSQMEPTRGGWHWLMAVAGFLLAFALMLTLLFSHLGAQS